MNEQQVDLSSKEVADFLVVSHDALVGLVPFNPEISKTDECDNALYDDKNSENP